MSRLSICTILALLILTVSAYSSDYPESPRYRLAESMYSGVITGQPISQAKATADTIYLMGGPDRTDGDFEGEDSDCSWDGWTSIDLTQRTEVIWHCDDYHCQNLDPSTVPNHAWWCGVDTWTDDCGTGDYSGYGNGWLEYLDWNGTVPNNALPTTVTVQAVLNYDNEPGYDFLYFGHETATGMVQDAVYNGLMDSVVVALNFTVTPADYTGPGDDEVHLRWWFSSDGGWSDGDCLWPTQGAAQVDLIDVFFDQGGGPVQQGVTEDCEGGPAQWFVAFPAGVGDFAQLWQGLQDLDPCRSNSSCVVGFIDDGIVVPGTGGYLCTTWCYGPSGYIVNPEGGLAGPEFHLNNEIWSPVLAWPDPQYVGAAFEFDVYVHEQLTSTSPGVFYVWHVRSTDSSDPADIQFAGWRDRNLVYFSPAVAWFRHNRHWESGGGNPMVVTDLMVQDRQFVQCALGVYELGWVWGFVATDGSPAPYFDNVAFLCFGFSGPAVSAREFAIAQDNFPEIGTYDYGNLAANSIRFDMAMNIALPDHMRNDPGDTIIIDVVPVRSGSVLNDLPKLYYKLKPNPVFDPVRTFPNEGWVYGDTTYTGAGTVIGDRYNFDLPDTGFFFPGDVIHYYVEAQDNVSGDIGTTLVPGDTTGFSFFPGDDDYVPLFYDPPFVVRGLPTFSTLSAGAHPTVLFWNDILSAPWAVNEWHTALSNLGYQEGIDYDVYYTNGPGSAAGSGLGGRATATQLMGYETILYACGWHSSFTLSNGDFQSDPSNDVGVLDSWLRTGDKSMFLTGDDLVFDLVNNGGAATLAFANNWICVTLIDHNLRPLVDYQAAPLVKTIPGNSVFNSITEWIAYGGCLVMNTFDAVEVAGTTERLAEFTDPNGTTGQYSFAAATLNEDATFNNNIVYLPYDLINVYTDPANPPPQPALSSRAQLLSDVLLSFGHIGQSPATPVPEAGVFSVDNYPNPFNPHTKIAFNLPRRGELSLRIYNLRGELVRILINEMRPAGEDFVVWDGSDDSGRGVASGMYFCEARFPGERQVQKMALVR